MTLSALNSIFGWTAVIAALLAFVSTVGLWWTGAIIDSRKQQEIAGLHQALGTVQPRTISEPQQAALIGRLSKFEKMTIGFSTKIFDQEAKQFAQQFAHIFGQAGWNVIEPINAQLLDDYDGKINIIAVSTGTAAIDANLTATADQLFKLISDEGIPCKPSPVRQGAIGGQLAPGSIYLLIGSHVGEHG